MRPFVTRSYGTGFDRCGRRNSVMGLRYRLPRFSLQAPDTRDVQQGTPCIQLGPCFPYKQKQTGRMVSSGLLRRVAIVRTDVSEEPRFLQEPHGVTTQKTPFFLVTAVKTSNLTKTNTFRGP
jgi:hypothetical protein